MNTERAKKVVAMEQRLFDAAESEYVIGWVDEARNAMRLAAVMLQQLRFELLALSAENEELRAKVRLPEIFAKRGQP